jgi:hypothetical protein
MDTLLIFYIALFQIRIKCDRAVYRKLQLQLLYTRWQPPDWPLIVNRTTNATRVKLVLIP